MTKIWYWLWDDWFWISASWSWLSVPLGVVAAASSPNSDQNVACAETWDGRDTVPGVGSRPLSQRASAREWAKVQTRRPAGSVGAAGLQRYKAPLATSRCRRAT